MQLVDLQISCGCIQARYQARKGLHIGQLKLTQINFAMLNSHVIVIFKIYQKPLFLCGKTEKLKIAVLVFVSKKNVIINNKMASENLTFQDLLKSRKLLPAEKFGNILGFKKCKRKLLSLMSADSFIKNNTPIKC